MGSLSDDILGDRIAAFLRKTGVGTRADQAGPGADHAGGHHVRGGRADVHVLRRAALLRAARAGRRRRRPGRRGLGALRGLDRPAAGAVPGRRPQGLAGAGADAGVRPERTSYPAARRRRGGRAARAVVEEFFATADLVKLSSADADVLYGGAEPAAAAERIRELGARAVVVTCGAQGAYVAAADGGSMLPAPKVAAVDATGAGDSVMGALVRRLLADGLPGRPGRLAAQRAVRAGGGRPGLRAAGRRHRDADQRGAHRPLGSPGLVSHRSPSR